ncbi:Txe/YoeB family addiction module toxin [Candidatus Peregrinibacteria bacterium]|nr:Txe/YoeB family addiction module toxin [Candidatus Peregrinibacteria bacterium]
MPRIRFTEEANKDFRYWKRHDSTKTRRIEKLCKDATLHPFEGIGKPEPLKFDLHGCWSRRIDRINRLVYQVTKKEIVIISCRYHY